MTEEERTAQITQSMRFERKPAVTASEKAAYAALEAACGDALRSLRSLNLRAWRACAGDYRAARGGAGEVRCRAGEVRRRATRGA